MRTLLSTNFCLAALDKGTNDKFVCPECRTPVADLVVKRRRERGFDWLDCPVCSTRVWLLDREQRLKAERSLIVSEMDWAADAGRAGDTAATILQGKIATGDFDVFLCHNSEDKPAVKEIGKRLKERGILPWLDEWELRPGRPWQGALESHLQNIKSVAVFVGKSGIGPWHNLEIRAFLREFAKRRVPIIPVILQNAPKTPDLLPFLEGRAWIDYRKSDPDPLERLIWGITGKKDSLQ